MRKTLFFTLLMLVLVVPLAGAQISTGEPHSSVIPRTGNRPQAGDWGLYLGGSVRQVIDLVDAINRDGMNAWALPIVNLKYYVSDEFELRLGFEFSATSEKENTSMTGSYSMEEKNGNNFTRFLPGVAYHFSSNNILDVYAGAQLPIGWEAYSTINRVNGDRTIDSNSSTFVIGAGLFIGLQMFIADLPFAIGVETGFSGLLKSGGSTNTTYTSGVDESANQTIVTTKQNLRADWGADAALTFSYYFH